MVSRSRAGAALILCYSALHAPCTCHAQSTRHAYTQVLFYFARFPGIFEPGAHRPRRAPHRDRARCGV